MTKQIVVRCLIRKRKHLHGKRAEEIENDMKIVEQLNLNLINSNSFKEVSFFLGRKRERGVLFVDAKNRPVNDQYEKLYEVLVKYDLINKLPDL